MHSTAQNLQVLFEDNHLIIVNKRCGDIVQGDKTGDIPLSDIVKEYIKEKYQKPGAVFLGTTHRLDRPTSGIVIFAKTSKALERINKMFRDKEIKKTYWALVKNKPQPEQAELQNYLVKNPKNNKSKVTSASNPKAKLAILDYTLRQALHSYFLLEINLHTGRHHQIRSQLSHIGCPIKGDLKYGFPRSNKDAGISLHSRKVSFIHPVKKEAVTLVAPCPPDPVWDACK
ncbi:MAG: RluA family pseudouridine synthase [Flavobacteriaceae bacterium]